ncbi:unnamed protein product [Amoebophrya sp. A25]|nr:unnamed protein product [Amoebophrya sp. A25]|eukprot:GSA25T00003635001.1
MLTAAPLFFSLLGPLLKTSSLLFGITGGAFGGLAHGEYFRVEKEHDEQDYKDHSTITSTITNTTTLTSTTATSTTVTITSRGHIAGSISDDEDGGELRMRLRLNSEDVSKLSGDIGLQMILAMQKSLNIYAADMKKAATETAEASETPEAGDATEASADDASSSVTSEVGNTDVSTSTGGEPAKVVEVASDGSMFFVYDGAQVSKIVYGNPEAAPGIFSSSSSVEVGDGKKLLGEVDDHRRQKVTYTNDDDQAFLIEASSTTTGSRSTTPRRLVHYDLVLEDENTIEERNQHRMFKEERNHGVMRRSGLDETTIEARSGRRVSPKLHRHHLLEHERRSARGLVTFDGMEEFSVVLTAPGGKGAEERLAVNDIVQEPKIFEYLNRELYDVAFEKGDIDPETEAMQIDATGVPTVDEIEKDTIPDTGVGFIVPLDGAEADGEGSSGSDSSGIAAKEDNSEAADASEATNTKKDKSEATNTKKDKSEATDAEEDKSEATDATTTEAPDAKVGGDQEATPQAAEAEKNSTNKSDISVSVSTTNKSEANSTNTTSEKNSTSALSLPQDNGDLRSATSFLEMQDGHSKKTTRRAGASTTSSASEKTTRRTTIHPARTPQLLDQRRARAGTGTSSRIAVAKYMDLTPRTRVYIGEKDFDSALGLVAGALRQPPAEEKKQLRYMTATEVAEFQKLATLRRQEVSDWLDSERNSVFFLVTLVLLGVGVVIFAQTVQAIRVLRPCKVVEGEDEEHYEVEEGTTTGGGAGRKRNAVYEREAGSGGNQVAKRKQEAPPADDTSSEEAAEDDSDE